MTVDRKARIAVLGAGLIGRRHAMHVAREADLAAIVDPAPATKELAEENSVPWFASLAELLASEKPDGVIVATPNQLHEANGLECIEAGVPILVEKPITDNVEAAERLVIAGEAAGVPILVGHHRRHNPLIERARDKISAGSLGQLVAVHAMCWFYKPDPYFDVAWRREPGAGPVFINLIHDIDLLRHLCGEIISVQAQESNTVRGHNVEDTAVMLLKFANGALGTVTVSDTIVSPWSWELTAAENPDYPVTGASSYMIGGTRGSLSVPDLGLWQNETTPSWWEPIGRSQIEIDPADPLVRQVRHFSDVALGRADPLVTGREGLKTLKVIVAVKEAARSGRIVEIG